jgi:serine/threonine-protein kinase
VADLLSLTSTTGSAEALVRRSSVVQQTFDHHTQDSGNVSWLVDSDGVRLFVKTAGPVDAPPGVVEPALDHAGRVALLANAVRLARSCDHAALATLRNVITTSTGPALVYDAAPGELVRAAPELRSDPASAYQRLAQLPSHRLLAVCDVLVDLHVALAEQGWVACDLYDGCLIVAPDDRLTVIDLDSYHLGPFTNTMGRMFGSTRYMAPEELTLGATIDQRTTVFTLARMVIHFATRLTDRLEAFVGFQSGTAVLRKASHPDPLARYPTVAEFASAWTRARRR